MVISINRRKIESTCIFISFFLVIGLTTALIFVLADDILGWNILSKQLEKIAGLFLGSIGLIVAASFLISMMANVSLISQSLEQISDKLDQNEQ